MWTSRHIATFRMKILPIFTAVLLRICILYRISSKTCGIETCAQLISGCSFGRSIVSGIGSWPQLQALFFILFRGLNASLNIDSFSHCIRMPLNNVILISHSRLICAWFSCTWWDINARGSRGRGSAPCVLPWACSRVASHQHTHKYNTHPNGCSTRSSLFFIQNYDKTCAFRRAEILFFLSFCRINGSTFLCFLLLMSIK